MSALALAPQQLTAREYLRVSKDRSGRLVSVDQQHTDNQDLCTRRGWTLGAPYTETSAVSASRYSRKVRSDFASLLSDLSGGRFGADVLIVWEASRGSRQTSEWLRLIDAAERASVLLCVDGNVFDPSQARDRRELREDASDAEYESDKISKRVGRAMRAEAAAGNPHGRKVYGYDRQYRIDDGTPLRPHEYRLSSDATKIARQVPNPEESAAVRLVYASLKAGESMRSIAAALNGDGPRPAMGAALAAAAEAYRPQGAPGVWVPTRVRDVALNPVYAGKRLHVPGGHLASARQAEYSLADLQPGNWPALVSFADWCEVSAKLRATKPSATMPGRQPKHLLSLIATCGVCGGPLAVRYKHRAGRATYLCQRGGHVSADRDSVDAVVTAAVLERLSAADVYPAMTPADSADLAEARAAEATARAEHADLAAQLGAGRISAALAAAAEPSIMARIEQAAQRVRDLQSPGKLSSMGLAPGADIFARWQAAPLSARREAVRQLFARIAVNPAGRHYSGTVTDRLDIAWR